MTTFTMVICVAIVTCVTMVNYVAMVTCVSLAISVTMVTCVFLAICAAMVICAGTLTSAGFMNTGMLVTALLWENLICLHHVN